MSPKTLYFLENPLWIEVFKKIRPALKLPSRKILSGKLLDAEFNDTKEVVDILVSKAKNLALQLDGWSNLR